MAYGSLANHVKEDALVRLYEELGCRFLEFVEIFTYISQRAQIHNSDDLLRLYERYQVTGSSLAKEQLIERGILSITAKKSLKQ